jgi:UDP-N-acetylmuramoylalanine-D-glutamate ligase
MNGRSLLVQNYDGITLVTPNKTHNMETRLDLVIKSPGLALRSRSVQRMDQKNESELSTDNQINRSIRKSRRCAYVRFLIVLY